MDRVLLERKIEEHKDLSIRMDQFLFRKFGLAKNQVNLKIDEYYLNCVPFDLSLTTCHAISILGAREIEFFSEYVGTTQNLNLSLDHPSFSKRISLFIRVKLESFKQHNPDSNVCIIGMRCVTIPNDFKEIFVGVADELASCKALYEDETNSTAPVDLEAFRNTIGRPYFTIRDETKWEARVKASNIAPRRLILFVDVDAVELAQGAEIEIEYELPGVSLTGTVASLEPSTEAPGYAFATIDVQYSPSYVDLIYRIADSSASPPRPSA